MNEQTTAALTRGRWGTTERGSADGHDTAPTDFLQTAPDVAAASPDAPADPAALRNDYDDRITRRTA